jgi:hypothetical protein
MSSVQPRRASIPDESLSPPELGPPYPRPILSASEERNEAAWHRLSHALDGRTEEEPLVFRTPARRRART